MNKIKVITQKIPLKNISNSKYLDFSYELTTMASNYDGFITSKFYNNPFDLDLIHKTTEPPFYNISDWKNIDYWNKWIESKERENIIKKFNFNFECNHTILQERKIEANIFLG